MKKNNLNNLKLRKESVKTAQEDCTAQHDECKKSNDTLQGLPDEPLAEVNTAYEAVKKFSKQTCFHERQVREVRQYMETAAELNAEADVFLKAPGEDEGESQ